MILNQRFRKILLSLSEREYTHLELLAQDLNLSPRTIRSLLLELKSELDPQIATIRSRRNLGIELEIHDAEAFDKLLQQNVAQHLPETAVQRKAYLLSYLMEHYLQYTKADNLCETLFISRKTLSQDLKTVEQFLQKYHLQLERKPYYGIKVNGEERNFRLCLQHMLSKYPTTWTEKISNEFFNQAAIQALITKHTIQCGYPLYEVDIDNIVHQFQISLYRMQHQAILSMEETNHISSLQEKDLHVAQSIALDLETLYGVIIPVPEIKYFAILLLSKKKSYGTVGSLPANSEVKLLVSNMLRSISRTFQINFTTDFDLNTLLLQHMVSLCIRLRYNLKLDNPMLEDIKENYSFAYAIAAHASTVLAEHFQTIVPEEEIGYLALCFALSLKKKSTRQQKHKVILVCNSGAGSIQLLKYRFEELFGDYLKEIQTCDMPSLEVADFTGIDYVFSTVPLTKPISVPVCYVPYFWDKQNIAQVKQILNSTSQDDVMSYFHPQLFFTNITGKNREEVIRNLSQAIRKVKEIPDDFEEYVLRREHLMQTDFCPYVAIPHPYKPITKETFVCVAILEKPIFWHIHDVQIIFLLSISTKKENLESFYDITTKFMMNEKYVKELIHEKNYETLLRIIEETKQLAP